MQEYIIDEEQYIEMTGYDPDDEAMLTPVEMGLEPLMRCRDCVHYDALTGLCSVNSSVVHVSVLPSGYCAWGEREDS